MEERAGQWGFQGTEGLFSSGRPRKGIRESEIIQAPRTIQKYPNKTVLLSIGEITRPKWMISVSIYLAKEREKEVVVSFPFPVLGRRNT